MRTIIIFFIIVGFFIGCSNKEKCDNKNKSNNVKLINKKVFVRNSNCQSVKIENMRNIPDNIVGAGCTFSFNDQFLNKEQYFWVDNITEGAMMINGRIEQFIFDTTESKSDVYSFLNADYRVCYRVINSKPLSDESSKLEGEMTVVKLDSNDSIFVKFIGLSY